MLALPLMLLSAMAPGAGSDAAETTTVLEAIYEEEVTTALGAIYEEEVSTADLHDLTPFMPSEIARLFEPVPPSPPPPKPPKPEVRVKAHPPRT